MHMLHVVHRYWPYRGGSEQYFQEISERLVNEGHRVTILTANAWDIEYFAFRDKKSIDTLSENHNGVQIKRFPVFHFPIDHCRVMRYISKMPFQAAKNFFLNPSPCIPSLYRYALKNDFHNVDIVHASPLPFSTFLYAGHLIARKHNVPFIVTPFIHTGEGNASPVGREYCRANQITLLKKASLLILQTQAEKNFLAERGINSDKSFILGMGVNESEIIGGDGVRFKQSHGIPPDIPVVLHVGAHCFNKGTIHLIEALKLLWKKGKEIQVVLAGPPLTPFTDYLRSQKKEVLRRVKLLEFVQGQEKKDMFSACDVLALPSCCESFGVVFLEAWLAKKPVIGAYAGGVTHVIDDGLDGFMVPFGNIYMLSEYIAKLTTDMNLARSFGERGFEKVHNKATWDKRYQTFKKIIDGLPIRRA